MGYAFAAWTVFVWATRVSNILDDGGASGAALAVDLAIAVAMTLLGLLVALATWKGRPTWALPALVVATVAVWGARTPLILLDPEHGAAFKAVHTGLALVSVGLAAAAWRTARARRSDVGHGPTVTAGR